MRGFLTIVITDDAPPKLIIEDGGQPFSFAEILQALQKAQSGILDVMSQAATQEEKKDDGEKTNEHSEVGQPPH